MNRSDKARAIVVFEELAAALRTEIYGEAVTEHASGSTPSWRMGDVTVSASLSNPSVTVNDPAALLAYVTAMHPDEVETVTTVQIRPAFQRALLARLAKHGEPLCDAEGTVIPGVKFVPGGALKSVSVRPTDDFKEAATRFALEVAAGQRQFALPAVGADEDPLAYGAAPWADPAVAA
jgi:hypothetical protein